MIYERLPNNPRLQSPPRLQSYSIGEPVTKTDSLESAFISSRHEDRQFGSQVGAVAALALALVSQSAQGGEVPAAVVAEAASVESASVLDLDLLQTQAPSKLENDPEEVDQPSLVEKFRTGATELKSKANEYQNKLDRFGILETKSFQLGEYNLDFTGAELDFSPKFKDGGLAFKAKGEFLQTELSKEEILENGWLRSQGFSAKIRGDFSSYKDPNLDIQLGLHRSYEGSLNDRWDGKFKIHAGLRERLIGENEGLRAGVSLRQEIEGGEFSLLGQQFTIYGEGRQSAFYNFETGDTDLNYRFRAGPKTDLNFNILGQELEVSAMVGPEIKGSSQGEALDFGIGTKFRFKF